VIRGALDVPFEELPGINPAWSQFIEVVDYQGVTRTFHILDSHRESESTPEITLVCVHGNPTWSYLWRNLLASAPPHIRVIAIDQLGMGFSERITSQRTLAERVHDLSSLVYALKITTPVVSIAHDWGGPISLGWVEQVLARKEYTIAGVVLLNTAVHQPEEFSGPALIRLARARGLLAPVTQHSPLFVRGTTILSGKKIPRDIARAFALPYRTSADRVSVRGFVADIPFEPDHPSRDTLDSIAQSLTLLASTPVLLCWGPRDPVFSDQYLRDLQSRLPHALVHRYVGASHLVSEDAPELVPDVLRWVEGLANGALEEVVPSKSSESVIDLGVQVRNRAQESPYENAITVMGGHNQQKQVSWGLLDRRIQEFAAGMRAAGIKPGDRIAFLIPPGPELIALIYAAWNIGACIVIADSGLGIRGIIRALRGAHPDHVFAIPRAMPITRFLQIPGLRISSQELTTFKRPSMENAVTAFDPDSNGAVVFTSGSTGPAKGVRYSRARINATVNVLKDHYSLTHSDVIIAAFAPWAVFGPALGVGSVLPQMDLGSPSSLTYTNLQAAINQAGGTLLWASPAALRNVVETAPENVEQSHRETHKNSPIRLILSAGAPVPSSLLRSVTQLFPGAQLRTPYGMTEALPLTDIALNEIAALEHTTGSQGSSGVPVGKPLPGVEIRISPWSASTALSASPLTASPGLMGEIVIKADHMRSSYDNLAFTQAAASEFPGWHRTGDVGHIDESGNVWVEGRRSHVISTAGGPVTPVPVEQRVERLPSVYQAACVGVGPLGNQVVVVIVVLREQISDTELQDSIRAVAGTRVSAVLRRKDLPMDIRHNAKINREKLAQWASQVLAGVQ